MPGLPVLPDGLTARPIIPTDLPAIAELERAAEQVDDTGEHLSADDLAEIWLNDLVDLPRDSLLVQTEGGEPVAWATLMARHTFRDVFRVYLEGRVHPAQRGRGIGGALLARQLARGAEVHAERHPDAPARLVVPVFDSVTGLDSLVRRAGLEPERFFFSMQRPLADLPVGPEVPGVELAPFSWDHDDEVRRAHNVAFTEHHGSSDRDERTWRTFFTGQRSFRPDLSVLALADGAVVGYVLAYVYDADTAATGVRETYLGQIGVLPQARGRGIARAAITAALRVAAENGCETAGLEVDSQNVTGALGLYEGLGFATRRTQTRWARSLPARGGTSRAG